MLDGRRVLYSGKKEVNYENQELDLCMYWDVVNMLTPGQYFVKAYIEGYEVGSTTMILK
jgi:hypothetical protein